MKSKAALPLILSLATLVPLAALAQNDATLWLTDPAHSVLLQRQSPIALSSAPSTSQIITVDPAKTYQTMDGFGYALTGGSAQLLMKMDPAKRAELLKNLFTTEGEGIGVSYLRLTIGSSDMNPNIFSYDDLPEGKTDTTLAHFSIDPDKADVIPIMKQILTINPKIQILASPWSAPVWMKSNDRAKGGVLKPEYFHAYADYFVKYIQAMKAQGISIHAVTIQNEPLNENNTPSMLMVASEQAEFIKTALGPAFKRAGIKTKIFLYDHNLDRPDYPLSILRDPAAAQYVDGSAFHLYGGTVDAMTQVHDAFPQKNVYFTEQMVIDPDSTTHLQLADPVAHVIIGVARNWSKTVLLWNLAADTSNGPHTADGGCPICTGALTIDGDTITRNVAYYALAQASKFVPPGSIRIDSNDLDTLPNVAFKTPDGKKVLIVSNTSNSTQKFDVRIGSNDFTTSLNAGAVGTYVW
jgi:glucosylceramidase